MSRHALMGRPAARLETMTLVNQTHVLVENVGKKAINSPQWVRFLNLCDRTPVFIRHIAYQESNVV